MSDNIVENALYQVEKSLLDQKLSTINSLSLSLSEYHTHSKKSEPSPSTIEALDNLVSHAITSANIKISHCLAIFKTKDYSLEVLKLIKPKIEEAFENLSTTVFHRSALTSSSVAIALLLLALELDRALDSAEWKRMMLILQAKNFDVVR